MSAWRKFMTALRDFRTLLFVALALGAIVGANRADAANEYSCTPWAPGMPGSCPTTYPSVAAATAACAAHASDLAAQGYQSMGSYSIVCAFEGPSNTPTANIGQCYYTAQRHPATSGIKTGYHCGATTPPGPTPEECEARPSHYSNFIHALSDGAVVCEDNCMMEALNPGDGGQVGVVPLTIGGEGQPCDNAVNFTCPTGYKDIAGSTGDYIPQRCIPEAGDEDEDGTPNDEDEDPFQNEATPDSDGDGVPDDKDVHPNDPDNGEGEDGEADNTSTGGGTCTSPPVSTGDGIAAMIAYQTWATRCEAKRTADKIGQGINVTVAGGSTGGGDAAGSATTGGTNCATPYVCTGGDNVACAQLKEAHKTKCLAQAGEDRVSDILANGAPVDMGGDGDPDGIVVDGDDLGETVLDANGWLGSDRSCPAEPAAWASMSAQGYSYATIVCDPLAILGALMVFAMYVHGAFILGKAAAGQG